MKLIDRLFGRRRKDIPPADLPVEGEMPEIEGIAEWINTPPLSKADLKGKVVLVDFWTYSCINCIRTLPHVNAWHEAYADKGLVILGIHTPEFEFEKDPANVRAAVERYGVRYPVALDNDYKMWTAYGNRYWPAHYFIDRDGRIRYHHFGESGYDMSETVIRTLLAESGAPMPDETAHPPSDDTDLASVGSPETYLGHRRLEYLGSPETVVMDRPSRYTAVRDPALNVFYFDGEWEIRADNAIPVSTGARILYRYRASKANLVMDADGATRRVEVMLDGEPVAADRAGADVKGGAVEVAGGRLYSIIDAHGDYGEHLLELRFPDPGVKCYAFTFG